MFYVFRWHDAKLEIETQAEAEKDAKERAIDNPGERYFVAQDLISFELVNRLAINGKVNDEDTGK